MEGHKRKRGTLSALVFTPDEIRALKAIMAAFQVDPRRAEEILSTPLPEDALAVSLLKIGMPRDVAEMVLREMVRSNTYIIEVAAPSGAQLVSLRASQPITLQQAVRAAISVVENERGTIDLSQTVVSGMPASVAHSHGGAHLDFGLVLFDRGKYIPHPSDDANLQRRLDAFTRRMNVLPRELPEMKAILL